MITMKKIVLFVAAAAALTLLGCKNREEAAPAEPTALEVIMSRTSIRNFTGEPVSREQLETILKAGMAAPSAMNVQPWRFVVVTEKEKIAQVLGIPEGVVPLCIIPVGIPAEDPAPKDKWKPENIHWEQW